MLLKLITTWLRKLLSVACSVHFQYDGEYYNQDGLDFPLDHIIIFSTEHRPHEIFCPALRKLLPPEP